MISVTLKNLPSDLHARLKERARLHQRSLNSELIACIRAAVTSEKVNADELLATARSLRSRVVGRLTDRTLARAKRQGRA
jgi:plasmid stability protein